VFLRDTALDLLRCIKTDQLRRVQTILQEGYSVDIAGEDIVHWCLSQEMTRALVEAKANVDTETLITHSMYGRTKIVEFLVKEAKVDVNARSSRLSPLSIAISNNHIETVTYMVENLDAKLGINIDGLTCSLLSWANTSQMVRLLIDKKANVDQRSLLFHSMHGATQIVEILLKESKVNINGSFQDHTALSIATDHAQVDMVKLLVRMNADVNHLSPTEYSCAHMAAYSGHTEILEFLVEAKANMNVPSPRDGYTPFMLSILKAEETAMVILNKAKVELDTKNFDGETALIVAMVNSAFNVSLELIKKGASVNIASDSGTTAAILAITYDNVQTLKLLVKHKAYIDRESEFQKNFLLIAASFPDGLRRNVMDYLLEDLKFNINVRVDGKWATPLEAALGSGGLSTVEYLLKKKASPLIPISKAEAGTLKDTNDLLSSLTMEEISKR